MVSIRTESLREQADVLNTEALHYNKRFSVMEECLLWIRRQEFDEANEIHRILTKQYEELIHQKKEMILMAEVMQRICDKYDRTEQRILDSEEKYQKPIGHIESINLKDIRDQLSELGISMER